MDTPISVTRLAQLMAKILESLSDIAHNYDHFILDIYGVIHNGIQLFPGTVKCLENLNAAGKQVCLLSNSPRRAAGAASQMERMGLPSELFHHIVTSGEETHLSLATYPYGKRCWFIGTDIMREVLEGLDITLVDDYKNADFILNSVPDTHPDSIQKFYDDLSGAAPLKLPMICANPDLVVNIGEHQYKCAGTFAQHYEDQGGPVIYHGKPYAPVYERCHTLLGSPDKSTICAIGDSFHTDITGANTFGISCVFNIEGIHEEELTCPVNRTITDSAIHTMIAKQNQSPTYVLKGFEWVTLPPKVGPC